MRMRIIKHILSNDGQDFGSHLVLVPLDDTDSPQHAIVDADDFYRIVDSKCSKRWYLDKNGHVVLWGKRPCQVKRLISNAGVGESVRFRNDNPLDLRRHNLRLVPDSRAKNSEWDYVYNTKTDVEFTHQWSFRPPTMMGPHLSFIGPNIQIKPQTPLFSSRAQSATPNGVRVQKAS